MCQIYDTALWLISIDTKKIGHLDWQFVERKRSRTSNKDPTTLSKGTKKEATDKPVSRPRRDTAVVLHHKGSHISKDGTKEGFNFNCVNFFIFNLLNWFQRHSACCLFVITLLMIVIILIWSIHFLKIILKVKYKLDKLMISWLIIKKVIWIKKFLQSELRKKLLQLNLLNWNLYLKVHDSHVHF